MREFLKQAMEHIKRRGAEYADARWVRGMNEILVMRNGELETASVGESEGFGIRVLLNGAWGFSSSSSMTPSACAHVRANVIAPWFWSRIAARASHLATASASAGSPGATYGTIGTRPDPSSGKTSHR